MILKRVLPTSLKLRIKRALSPWRVSMGAGSFMHRPYLISNPKHIQLGKDVTILADASLLPITLYAGAAYQPLIRIGDGTYIGRQVSIHAIDNVEIEAGCVLSDFVYLSDLSHGFDPNAGPIMEQPLSSRGPVHIGKRCFLGYRVAVMPGVTLGEHCIVGAHSVVTHSFPPFSVIGGVPARLLRTHGPKSVPAA